MRRFLAILGLIFAVGGFVLLAFSIKWNIHFLIPVGMIFASFILLIISRRMQEPPASPRNDGEKKE